MRVIATWLLALLCAAACATAGAHSFAPSLLSLRERADGQFDVTWKTPRFGMTPVPLQPRLPSQCRETTAPQGAYEGTGVRQAWTVRCARTLVGESLAVGGLAENQAMALVRIEWRDGTVQQGTLSAAAPGWTVPAQPERWRVALDYATLGVTHILGGPDHLLFVLGLILLVRSGRPLVWTITAFTAGHSVTLALAALGVLRYPVALIEFLIAASIFVVAVELTREASEAHWLRRRPWLAAASFGLLHGMGFAGALLETGLPANAIPLALLCFNIGIELGQLLFVAAVLVVGVAWARLVPPRFAVLRWVPVYVIGVGSAYWCIERASIVITGGG